MRSQAVHRASGFVLSVLGVAGLVLALAACTAPSVSPAATATAPATPTPPVHATLTCAYTLVPLPYPPVQPATKTAVGQEVELLCLVTGVPSSDTTFTLTVVVRGQSPPLPPASSPCVGPLQQGKGACAHTYLLGIGPPPVSPAGTKSAPFTIVVFCVLYPSGHRLAPVTPILASSG